MDHITVVGAPPNRRGGPFGARAPGHPLGHCFELRRSNSQNFPGAAARRYPDNMLG